MQHQINIDESGNPIYLNLELLGGSLFIKDDQGKLLKKTLGNPSKAGTDNELFTSIEEAYEWFLTTSLSNRLDESAGEE